MTTFSVVGAVVRGRGTSADSRRVAFDVPGTPYLGASRASGMDRTPWYSICACRSWIARTPGASQRGPERPSAITGFDTIAADGFANL